MRKPITPQLFVIALASAVLLTSCGGQMKVPPQTEAPIKTTTLDSCTPRTPKPKVPLTERTLGEVLTALFMRGEDCASKLERQVEIKKGDESHD